MTRGEIRKVVDKLIREQEGKPPDLPDDFTDVEVRRFDGAVAEIIYHAGKLRELLDKLKDENPYITLDQLPDDVGYHVEMLETMVARLGGHT